MQVIETEYEYKSFLQSICNSNLIIIPVYSDNFKHYVNNRISFVFIYDLQTTNEYVISLNHKECICLQTQHIQQIRTTGNIFVYNKKAFVNTFAKHVIDLDLVYWFQYNTSIPTEDCDTIVHDTFQRWYHTVPYLNDVIPITVQIERCKNIINKTKHIVEYVDDAALDIYNQIGIDNLATIERNGLYVNYEEFTNTFKANHIEHNTAFTEYNLYTSTGRASNRFGGVNYAALTKDTGARRAFISRFSNGMMVEFDFDSYHIRLIGDMLGYEFPANTNIHEYLGRYYFDKTSLTDDEYAQAKSITFKQIYGGIDKQYIDIPFFKQTKQLIGKIWQDYQFKGYAETPIYKRRFKRSWFNDMNANKLFNYILQATETERNFKIINNVMELLQNKNSKLVLYTYDSFLFDYDINDGKQLILDIKTTMSENERYPVTIHAGKNYHDMLDMTKKVS
jgi:hypothetical protein